MRAGVVDTNVHIQHLAVRAHFPALYDVKFVAMRRSVIVDERLVVQPCGVDDQGVAAFGNGQRTRRTRTVGDATHGARSNRRAEPVGRLR